MFPTYNQNKAKEHIVVLWHSYIKGYEEAVAKEITKKLLSGEIVIPDLDRGDAIRVKPFPNSPNRWYRNEGLFLFDGISVVPLDTTIDEYGHVPEEFYWPAFPIDYWIDTITHNTLVPVRFDEVYNLTAKHVKVILLEQEDRIVDIPVIETPEFLIIYPLEKGFGIDKATIADEIMNARHVDLILPGAEFNTFAPIDWEADYEDFRTDKPILVVIPQKE